jgi:hypothetical protein
MWIQIPQIFLKLVDSHSTVQAIGAGVLGTR